jgi:hypothetical protein
MQAEVEGPVAQEFAFCQVHPIASTRAFFRKFLFALANPFPPCM